MWLLRRDLWRLMDRRSVADVSVIIRNTYSLTLVAKCNGIFGVAKRSDDVAADADAVCAAGH